MAMRYHAGDAESDRSHGFFSALKNTVTVFGAVLHTRLELFVTELEEERERLKQALILTLLAFFGFSLGIILLTIFVVAIFWQSGWIYAVGVLAAVYLSIGVIAGLLLRNAIAARPVLFSATLEELRKDRDRLRAASHE
jgi:uncharacterized membrane protein YqjE